MRNFAYARPSSAPEAMAALGPDAMLIAGGTELLNWQRLGIAEPVRLIDIGRLAPLRGIAKDGDTLVIGALSTLNEVGEHPLVVRHAGMLAQSCLKAASAQIRNRATLGGNVLQKTRCPYFRAEAPLPWGCNKRQPGTGCAALEGVNDRLAILGTTDVCVATQPSDPAVALAALDAEAVLVSPRGRRELAMTDFHLTQAEARAEAASGRVRLRSREEEARMENRLRPDELIANYRIPIREGERSAYLKVRERESYEYALVSAAAGLVMDGDRIGRVRVALGSVAQKPWRLEAAEDALRGRALTREALLPPIERALADARPLSHNGYKVRLAANTAVRAIQMAGGAA